MSIFSRILIGLCIAAIGFLFIWKTRKFMEVFGSIDWAESKLGGGGTVLMYKVIGLLFIFIGFVVTTDMWDAFLQATLGSFLPKSDS